MSPTIVFDARNPSARPPQVQVWLAELIGSLQYPVLPAEVVKESFRRKVRLLRVPETDIEFMVAEAVQLARGL